MKVHEVMTPAVVTVSPETSLRDAARSMRQLDIGTLPICEGGRLLGIVTDRDIAVRATAEGRDPETTSVLDVMTPGVVSCFETDELEEAARIMQEAQLRRLVVMNEDRRAVGIVTVGDIALRTGDRDLAGETLESISDRPLGR